MLASFFDCPWCGHDHWHCNCLRFGLAKLLQKRQSGHANPTVGQQQNPGLAKREQGLQPGELGEQEAWTGNAGRAWLGGKCQQDLQGELE
jgi:hypothetical protein